MSDDGVGFEANKEFSRDERMSDDGVVFEANI